MTALFPPLLWDGEGASTFLQDVEVILIVFVLYYLGQSRHANVGRGMFMGDPLSLVVDETDDLSVITQVAWLGSPVPFIRK